MTTQITKSFKAVFTGEFNQQQAGIVFAVIFVPVALALSALIISGLIHVSPY